MNIVLIGFMGTGKSTVGHALATRLRAKFVDVDAEIEREAGKHVAEIFSQDGEPAFRDRETRYLQRLTQVTESMIISTGGGAPMQRRNVALLKKLGKVIWLTAPPQAILRRVQRNLSHRPLLSSHAHDPLERIGKLLTERTPIYRSVSDYEFDTSNWETSDEVAGCILSILGLSHEPCLPPKAAKLPSPPMAVPGLRPGNVRR